MSYYYLDVEDLNRMLESAICRCIYRINGLCDPDCLAQVYCEPESNGLKLEKILGGDYDRLSV